MYIRGKIVCYLLFAVVFANGLLNCNIIQPTPEKTKALEVSLLWNECFLELDRYSEGYRPPVSARMFAYAGITAWETALPGLPDARSVMDTFSGIQLPRWDGKTAFVLPAALNAAYKTVAECFFPHTPLPQKEKCAQIFQNFSAQISDSHLYPPEAITASAAYGKALAKAVYLWSATDTIGHMAYLFNYDRQYRPPENQGLWRPSTDDPVPMPALLPHWGRARTFVVHAEDITVNPPVPFSTEHSSLYFAQALEVFSLTQPIKEENRWIAEFWSDDIAGVTYSTASRWISIANQVIQKQKPDIGEALATWLRIGLALNDGAVLTWRAKYYYNTERPEMYIRENIRPDWKPLYSAQAFPAYPSGHSNFASSSATILSAIYGSHYPMTDYSHEGRKEFLGRPRSFRSFQEMATENALSRIYIGVHLRMDCEEGLRLGRLVGDKVMALPLRK